MIDNFVLGLTHGLMLLAAWRLLSRADLEDDSIPPESAQAPSGWAQFAQRRKPDDRRA
jgi:hypothetical protein